MININLLPKEIRDRIELKEVTDMTFGRFVDEPYDDIWWNILAERANPGVEHSMLVSIVGQQGSGKSLSAISMCCFMDPTFDVSRIFFSYEELVNARHLLKENTAVLVDEQSELFGLDSHRISIILQNLKEQLRKKSIHFFFCAPTLYPESKTSMYIIECMFIDYGTEECYAALKTRDELTLGHIAIPHPLKRLEDGTTLASKELMDAYQKKKDAHLEKILGKKNVDMYEEWAEGVMKDPFFRKAERIYVKKMGYVPQGTLIQIINKIRPEFNAGVAVMEIAGRIKLQKETSFEWEVAGHRGNKKEKRGKRNG